MVILMIYKAHIDNIDLIVVLQIAYRPLPMHQKCLMAQWLKRQHLRDMKCTVHDLEIMSSNPGGVKHGVLSNSVQVVLES